MLYELRTYEPTAGNAEPLLARFKQHTLRLFPIHGIEVLGLFDPEPHDGRFAYLTRFADEAARKAAWAAFGSDPEWQRIKADSETNGPLLKTQTVSVMAAVEAGLALG